MCYKWKLRCFAFFLSISLAFAQTTRHDTVVVTGTADPAPLEEADRSIVLLPVKDQTLLSNTLADFLRLDPSLDLAARAPGGVQADLSIRGATFGQTLFLLNGLRINDAQSAHHNLDIPMPLDAVSRVEVLHGSGSTLYGSDAIGGVVNVITEPPESSEVRLRLAAGNFGVNQQRGSIAAALGRVSESLVFSREFSSGFRPGRDYRDLALASTTRINSRLGTSDVVLGYGDKPFGADQFYGNFNSWEDTKTWFASLTQQLGAKTTGAVSFRRHSDLFVLYRDRPAFYANHHSDKTWQVSLRRRESLGRNVGLHYGAEGFHDSILSNNLGAHARNRAAAYATVDFRALRRFSLSLGAREEVYRSYSGELSPTISGGVWLAPRLKLRASASRAFRVPTYTELYYHDPANLGNPYLRPERGWTYEAGLDWNASGRLRAGVTVFERRLRDGIDYFRRSRAELWRAANIDNLQFTGVEATVSVRPARSQTLDLRFTGLRGAQKALPGLESKYVFNYPSQSGIVSWYAALPRDFVLRTRVGVLNRRARSPYALWDFYAACSRGRVRPFVQLTNLTGTNYQEIPGVVMPGRAVVGGIEMVVFRRK